MMAMLARFRHFILPRKPDSKEVSNMILETRARALNLSEKFSEVEEFIRRAPKRASSR